MKKLSLLIIVLFVTVSLFSYSEGAMMFSFGLEETLSPEIDHSLYGLEFNYEKTWFYEGRNVGISNDISLNIPISYRLGRDYSEPFNTFKTALSFDYSIKGIYRFKPIAICLGPSVRVNLFFTNAKTVVAEMLSGIENSIILDFPVSSSIGINTGLDLIVDIYRVDFMKNGARGFISPSFDFSLYLGLSLYYENGFSFT